MNVDSTSSANALCDLALDGLRFRKWVEGWNTSPIKLECLLDPCNNLDSYREAIDKFVVERGGK